MLAYSLDFHLFWLFVVVVVIISTSRICFSFRFQSISLFHFFFLRHFYSFIFFSSRLLHCTYCFNRLTSTFTFHFFMDKTFGQGHLSIDKGMGKALETLEKYVPVRLGLFTSPFIVFRIHFHAHLTFVSFHLFVDLFFFLVCFCFAIVSNVLIYMSGCCSLEENLYEFEIIIWQSNGFFYFIIFIMFFHRFSIVLVLILYLSIWFAQLFFFYFLLLLLIIFSCSLCTRLLFASLTTQKRTAAEERKKERKALKK